MKSVKYLFVVAFLIALYVFGGGPDKKTVTTKPIPANEQPQVVEVQPVPKDGPLVWPPATTEQVSLAADPMADNYLVMLDISGSMGGLVCNGNERKISAAKRAVKIFQERLDASDNVGLYSFSDRIAEVLPIGRHDVEAFGQKVDALRPGGGTPLRQALIKSEELLREIAQAQGGYGSYNLILITDGQSSDGLPGGQAEAIAKATAITIHAVGFCTGKDHSLNIPGYTKFSTAENADQLVESLSRTVQAEQDIFDLSDFDPS